MILFRYLARQVLSTMLAVTLVLLLVFMSGRFIKYLAQAASGGLSPDVLFQIMAYRLPGFLELILPLGFFLGILLAYGRMYLESEMTVMHACGYSRDRLLGVSMAMALAVAGVVGLMSLYLSPAGFQKVEAIFEQQSQVTEFEMLVPGRFQKFSGGDRVTYAESLSDDKRVMYEVFISDASGKGGFDLLHAKEGRQIIDDDGDRYLVLSEGTRYQGQRGEPDFEAISFDTYGILIKLPDAEQRALKDEAIPTLDLAQSEQLEHVALLQWRLSLPFIVPVVTLLAVALCRVNPRQGRFFHLLPSMLLYIMYLGALIVARKGVAKGEWHPVYGFIMVHALFLAFALAIYYKDALLVRFKLKVAAEVSNA